ncbi:MAG TPA: hypothetical protein VMD58_01100 [Acidobacteriaceae bacterium]|nr:hypothetical protein [Acidobacteriaceae bacterium]
MSTRGELSSLLHAANGILRLEPCWVPRSFMIPGGRLRLHPDDLYALGTHRGGINERWFSSTTQASNGPGTPEDEGLSYIRSGSQRILFKEAVDVIGDELLGTDVMERENGWNLLCKFFDNLGAIPHHLHQTDEFAGLVGQKGKPEAYYFPPQYNMKDNLFPFTFMGLEPGTTKDDVRHCLADWNKGDNGILYHSKAYRLRVGTGWQVDPGILHAPGSLVTYEPQVNSDVFAMFQSMVDGRGVDRALLVKDVLPQFWDDLDYLVSMLDWEANVDPEFALHHHVLPLPAAKDNEAEDAGFNEVWVTYGTKFYSAKELTVLPARQGCMRDSAAYGLIVTQGHGMLGGLPVEAPTMIRFGQMTQDELFVSAQAAAEGVIIENTSETEPLVLLKHFGPGNPDAPVF